MTKVKEESAKVGLQLNLKKTKIMATSLIDNWQIEGENMKAVTEFVFLGTADYCRCRLQPGNQKTFTSWEESNDKSR